MTIRAVALLIMIFTFSSCGRSHTASLLVNKTWEVYNVTPPANGIFNIDATNEAEDLKNGFYKNATFEFLKTGVFRTNFGGKVDSGNYKISYDGNIISLYPLHGTKMYEQIQLQQLTENEMAFNTVIANFHMTLYLRKK